MRISLILAMDKNRVIGLANRLPWHLPADLKHFKATTMGKPIIMGRKTYESIGRPLPGRRNIVMTRNKSFQARECEVVHSLPEALKAAGEVAEALIIGGAALFKEALPLANRIYLTRIDAEFEGDTFFPELNPAEWQEMAREDFPPDEKNKYSYSFIILDRRK